jgi:hypothetical protein
VYPSPDLKKFAVFVSCDCFLQYIKSAIIFLPNISEKIFYQYKLKEKKEN